MASKDTNGGKKQAKPAAKKKNTKPAAPKKAAAEKFKYRVVPGRDWPGLDFVFEGEGGQPEKLLPVVQKFEQMQDERKEAVDRRNLSATIVAASLAGLTLATVWGFLHADFSGVSSVWAVASVPVGLVVGHFFKSDGRKVKHS